MKLADVSVRRPVFAMMMSLALVVLGWFSYRQLGLDLFPNIDFPIVTVTTTLKGASVEEMETPVTKRDRGGGQHDRRHRRAALQLERGAPHGGRHVRARARHRGGAQDVRDKVAARAWPVPARHRPAADHEVRPRRVADPDARRLRRRDRAEVTRDRAQADQGGHRDAARRRLGAASRAAGERAINILLNPDRLTAYGPVDRARSQRRSRARTSRCRAAASTTGPAELSLRTMGRIGTCRTSTRSSLALHATAGRSASATSARVEDGIVEPRT